MDLVWLARNINQAWRRKERLSDFGRQILWIYGGALKSNFRAREWTIGFRYPMPVGNVRLLVRSNAGSDAFIHGEVFEHEYYRLPLEKAPETILDLGANIGITAVYFGRVFPATKLACVEPVPDNLRLLRQNLTLNDIRTKIFAAAVHDEDGTVEIELDAMDYGHRVAAGPSHGSTSALCVTAITVPTILAQLGWERIGLLKVDIEGHEKTLFAGACNWLSRVDAMCIEWHDETGKNELEQLARRFGFGPPQQLSGIWFLAREG